MALARPWLSTLSAQEILAEPLIEFPVVSIGGHFDLFEAFGNGPDAVEDFVRNNLSGGGDPFNTREAHRSSILSCSGAFDKTFTKLAPWPGSGPGDGEQGQYNGSPTCALENFAYLTCNIRLLAFLTMNDDDSWGTAVDRATVLIESMRTRLAEQQQVQLDAALSNDPHHLDDLVPDPLSLRDLGNDLRFAIRKAPAVLKAMLEFGGPYLRALCEFDLPDCSSQGQATSSRWSPRNQAPPPTTALSYALRTGSAEAVTAILTHCPEAPFHRQRSDLRRQGSSPAGPVTQLTVSEVRCWLKHCKGDWDIFTDPRLGFTIDDLCLVEDQFNDTILVVAAHWSTGIDSFPDTAVVSITFNQYIRLLFETSAFSIITRIIVRLAELGLAIPNNTIFIFCELWLTWKSPTNDLAPDLHADLIHLFATTLNLYPETRAYLAPQHFKSLSNSPLELALRKYPPLCLFLVENGAQLSQSFLQHDLWAALVSVPPTFLDSLGWLCGQLSDLVIAQQGDSSPLPAHAFDPRSINWPIDKFCSLNPLTIACLSDRPLLVQFLCSIPNLRPNVTVTIRFDSTDQSALSHWFFRTRNSDPITIPSAMTLPMALVLRPNVYRPISDAKLGPDGPYAWKHKPWYDSSGSDEGLETIIEAFIASLVEKPCTEAPPEKAGNDTINETSRLTQSTLYQPGGWPPEQQPEISSNIDPESRDLFQYQLDIL